MLRTRLPLVATLISATFLMSFLPAQSATIAGTKCTKVNSTKTVSNIKYTCVKSGKKLVWNKGVTLKQVATPTPTSTPSPSTSTETNVTPVPTNSQSTSATPTPSSTVINIAYTSPTVASENVEVCKLPEASKSRGMTGAAFPVWNTLTPSMGKVKWALIPIDFPDLKGESNFLSRVDSQMKLLSEWYETVSDGKFKIEWVVQDKWVTLPGKSSEYVIPNSVNLNNAANGPKLFKDAMDAADPVFDFSNIQTVNFILPSGQTFIGEGSQGFPWDQPVKDYKTKEGSISSYTIPGQFFDLPGKAYWSYWAHEFGHAIGLPHVGSSHGEMPPFNPLDLMGGQDGPTRELSGWIRFYAQWLADEKVYCKQASNLNDVELTLVPLSNSDSGLKLAIVPVSKTKAVLVESRRVTKFSCTTPTPGNGILVYTLDTTLGHGENFLIPNYPSGRPLERDSCSSQNSRSIGPIPDFLLHAGEKISVEGLTIEVLQHGNYDKIKITKN